MSYNETRDEGDDGIDEVNRIKSGKNSPNKSADQADVTRDASWPYQESSKWRVKW